MQKITPEATLQEVFDYFDRGENAVQVVPITISEKEDDTRLLLVVKGERAAASTIFAEVMIKVEELFDLQLQMEAENSESKPRIISG